MQTLRIEYRSNGALKDGLASQVQSIPVPDVATALVVAQLNHPEGEVELWRGAQRLARLERQRGDLSPLWRVS